MFEYNINQMNLSIPMDYLPKKDHIAWFINDLVEDMDEHELYVTGRPREYDARLMMKLIIFGYSMGIFSGRRLETRAQENIVAMWLTQ